MNSNPQGNSNRRRKPNAPRVVEAPPLKHHHEGLTLRVLREIFKFSIPYRTRFHVIPAFFTQKEMMMNNAMAFCEFNKVRGDYLEFGTYFGHSLIYAYHFARRHRVDGMHFYGFDSFKGLPPFEGVDDDLPLDRQYVPGDFACDVKTVRRNLRVGGVRQDDVTLVEGFYDESLTPALAKSLPIESAAVIWIDCDLYHSTKTVLDWVTRYVVDGTVLCFDDWFNFKGNPGKGENRAFTEWLFKNPTIKASPYQTFGWHGKSFILHR